MDEQPADPDPSAGSFVFDIRGIDPVRLLGPADANLRALAESYRSRITVRSGLVRVSGPGEEQAELKELLGRLVERCRKGEQLDPELVRAEMASLRNDASDAVRPTPYARRRTPYASRHTLDASGGGRGASSVRTPRKSIVARTPNQQAYLEAIARSEIVLAIGPAGTGKTYLAVAAAVEALTASRCNRIVLTRPAVEAGESLGYLPGTFRDKVDPYLRPLYDALFDMMPLERTRRLIDEEVIEVAALAFMRGRTLSGSYVILDEAQNTTSTQMRMFLTRLGWNSHAIVTGDVTQIDLEHPAASGLVEAERLLAGVRGISICRFTDKDVVRPPLVSRIINAYGRLDRGEPGDRKEAPRSEERGEMESES